MIQVSGTVYDMATGQGVPAATLAVNGQPVGAAGVGGDFILNLSGYDDQITVTSVGYLPATVSALDLQESGQIHLQQDVESLETATVTAPAQKKISPWWILAGIAVVASTDKGGRTMGATRSGSSNLIPIALLGVGAYLVLKPKTPAYNPYPAGYPNPTPVNSQPAGGSIFTPGNISTALDWFKDLFGGSGSENTQYGNYSSYDPSGTSNVAGIGATTTVNAGDILGHTLVAAMRVPLYDQASESAQPSGYVNTGQPVGIVFSYLNPDPSQGRSSLWWMFEPLPGNSDIGNDQGYYFTPHNPDYFDFQALADSGVLTVAQATALKNGTAPSTAEKLLDKYLPWLIGGIIAVGIGKAVINKAI